ncbi:hypothetical protein F7725_020753 [Dissostichus mawsoni]|uniref:Uncharacterized protein n=1 Tax=Dissostichus mawsoni TaxID=36200 RepID=A0A7J5YE54_DISMA|nr:hypothetical protein F7725_020753 [Dissostichus mawsoni]
MDTRTSQKCYWSMQARSSCSTDGNGHTALDLTSETTQREELLHSAHVGDSALRNFSTEVLNAASSLLANLIFTYRREQGLPHHGDSLSLTLVRALETHSPQKVTSGWTDRRVVRLVEDAETLLEFGRGGYLGQVSQAVRECKEENTLFLMEILEDFKYRGEMLLADL